MRDDDAVLVTGATGFIGREVVRRLLDDGHHVVALARPLVGVAPEARVRATLDPPSAEARLTVIGGDLTGLGFAAGDLAWLRATVTTVVHCAGDTRFFPEDLPQFRALHVDAPVALLDALAGDRLRRFAFVSTAFVCGRRRGRVLEDDGDVGQDFHNPYERAKLDAEAALAAAAAVHDLDVRMLRPSIVVGVAPATAGGAPSNLFFAVVRLLARAGALGRGRVFRVPGAPAAPFNIVPVEYVARAVVALAVHPEARSGTFHVVMSTPPTQTEMLAMVSRVLDLDGGRVVDARHLSRHASPLERRLMRILGPYREYLTQDVRFDDRRARAALDIAGVPPARLDAPAVERLVRLALASEAVTA